MEKQIEEMAIDLCPLYEEYGSCKKCDEELDIDDEPCLYKCMAKLCIEKDYSKASDLEKEIEDLKAISEQYRKQFEEARSEVAEEIFAEIEVFLKRTCEKGYCGSISNLLAELKKKYTESEVGE